MRRINKIQLLPTKNQRKILKEMLVLSSCVYNMSNYIIRNQFFKKEKLSSFHDLQQEIQLKDDYQLLGRSYGLPMIQKYSESIKGFFGLIKSKTQKYVSLPKYYKNRKTNTTLPSYLLMDGTQFSIDDSCVRIPLSNMMRKKYDIKRFHIKYNGVLRYQGNQCRSEIHYENKQFYLYQSIELQDVIKQDIKKSIGIDMGIKRLIASYSDTSDRLLIGSRRFYKQWNHYNNLIAKEQEYLSGINRKSSNTLKRLYLKRRKYQHQLFSNIIAKLFRFIKRNNTHQIFIGDVKGIREQKQSKDVNRMINNYWSYDKLYHRIACKAEEQGITMILLDESYTSMTCPKCNHKSHENKQDRVFSCVACGYNDDRDIVGAKNILSNGMWSHNTRPHQAEVGLLEVLS